MAPQGYFPTAKTLAELTPEQQGRYKELYPLKDDQLHPALQERMQVIRKYIGPITSGEIIFAFNELKEDMIVTWILAGEDPAKVEWSDPEEMYVRDLPPTEEEKRQTEEWLARNKEWLESWNRDRPKTLWERIRSKIFG